MVYLNNNIIYSNSKEYFQYVKQVLQRLIDKKMLVAIKKYKFYIIKTEFYRFIIKLGKLSNVLHGRAAQMGELYTSKLTKKWKNHILISQQPLNNKF